MTSTVEVANIRVKLPVITW